MKLYKNYEELKNDIIKDIGISLISLRTKEEQTKAYLNPIGNLEISKLANEYAYLNYDNIKEEQINGEFNYISQDY